MVAQNAGDAHESAQALSDELRSVVWILARRLRAQVANVSDIPLAQQAVLARLEDAPGMTSAELSRAEFVRPQSMNKSVSALRQAALVESSTSALDARRQELHLTPSGRALLQEVRTVRGDWLTARITEDLDDAGRETLAEAAVIMRRLAEQ